MIRIGFEAPVLEGEWKAPLLIPPNQPFDPQPFLLFALALDHARFWFRACTQPPLRGSSSRVSRMQRLGANESFSYATGAQALEGCPTKRQGRLAPEQEATQLCPPARCLLNLSLLVGRVPLLK